MLLINNYTRSIYRDLYNTFKKEALIEMDKQDLTYTKNLYKSIEMKYLVGFGNVEFDFYMEEYGIKIDRGYNRDDARQRVDMFGRQKYLDELKLWWIKKKGKSVSEANMAAKFTLRKHLKRGYESQRPNGFIEQMMIDGKIYGPLENADAMTLALYKHFKSRFKKEITWQ